MKGNSSIRIPLIWWNPNLVCNLSPKVHNLSIVKFKLFMHVIKYYFEICYGWFLGWNMICIIFFFYPFFFSGLIPSIYKDEMKNLVWWHQKYIRCIMILFYLSNLYSIWSFWLAVMLFQLNLKFWNSYVLVLIFKFLRMLH